MAEHRKPKLFTISWPVDEEHEQEGLACLPDTVIPELQSQGIHDYDIVWNSAEGDYRNDGRYMYQDGRLHDLDFDNYDDYGSLPLWTRLHPDDLGWSYFDEDHEHMICHNCGIPFHPADWKLIDTVAIAPKKRDFNYYMHTVKTTTTFERKLDGARLTVIYPVVLSRHQIGGLVRNFTEGGGHGDSGIYTNIYKYPDGDRITLKSRFEDYDEEDEDAGDINCCVFTATDAVKYHTFHITQDHLDAVRQRAKEALQSIAKPVYMKMTGPCTVYYEPRTTSVILVDEPKQKILVKVRPVKPNN